MIYATFYKISCKDKNIKDCYIGQTTNFNVRKSQHKSYTNNQKAHQYTYPLYTFIRENGGWNNFKMEILERLDCKDKEELKNNERHLIDFHKGTLNNRIPGRTTKEYTKEKLPDYSKKYIKKKYVKDKREKYVTKYREENRDKIKEKWNKNNITYSCPCGKDIKKYNLVKHYKTKSHIKKILKKLEPVCKEIKSLLLVNE